VDIPAEFNISSTFNVSDLRKYYPPEAEDAQLRTIAMREEAPDAEHLNTSVIKSTSHNSHHDKIAPNSGNFNSGPQLSEHTPEQAQAWLEMAQAIVLHL